MSVEPDRLNRLIARLADGRCHSGDALGRELGISRAAVWKQLRKLSEIGLAVRTERGRGYRLAGRLELLEADRILAGLSEPARQRLGRLELLPVVDSTNSRALERARASETGYVCLAEHQSAGRGRRGREWISPFGSNLYVSVSWAFEGGAAQLEGLSLAVGAALCEVLESQGFTGLGLKWPNDLLWDGRKLAGVLLEMTGDPAGDCQVVVGVGLNLTMSGAAAERIDQPWADLASVAGEQSVAWPGRNRLAATLIERLLMLLSDYAETGFEPWRERWLARDAFLDRPVALVSGASTRRGISRGVDPQGALLLEVDGECQACHGGELSMRAGS